MMDPSDLKSMALFPDYLQNRIHEERKSSVVCLYVHRIPPVTSLERLSDMHDLRHPENRKQPQSQNVDELSQA